MGFKECQVLLLEVVFVFDMINQDHTEYSHSR